MKMCERARSRVARLMAAATVVRLCGGIGIGAGAGARRRRRRRQRPRRRRSLRSRTRRRWTSSGRPRSRALSTCTTPTTSTRPRRRARIAVGGVAVFNCLYNFNVAHNSFTMSQAKLALENKPTTDSRGGFPNRSVGTVPRWRSSMRRSPEARPIYQNIEQAYISYLAPAGTGLQLDFGKFVTPIGQRSHRGKRQLELFEGTALLVGDSVLPCRRARDLQRQRQGLGDGFSAQRLEQRGGQQQGKDDRRAVDVSSRTRT